MKTTPLYNLHLKSGARMMSFAGWNVPLQYKSILAEATAVRTSVGLFDVSHMGRFLVTGPRALDLLQSLTTNDVGRLEVGRGQYTLMLNETGGVIDDLTVFRTGLETYMLVVNAANAEKDLSWISSQADDRVRIADITESTVLFALQGPKAGEMLFIACKEGLPDLRRFAFVKVEIAGGACTLLRTGYTGEDGYEIQCDAGDAIAIWEALRSVGEPLGLALCGLGARDLLRIEAGYMLYDHEISEEHNPIEAGLTRFVRMDKGDFVGRSAIAEILENGPRRLLTGLMMSDRMVPRGGSLVTLKGHEVGQVTSGTFSPSIERGIGLCYVTAEKSISGLEVEVIVREKPYAGRIASPPFYRT